MKWASRTGFTIVELLIVIVVIGILAAITIVAYNGVTAKATASQIQSSLAQANRQVLAYAVQNSDNYPSQLSDANIASTSVITYQYTSDNTVTPHVYALTASNGAAGAVAYYTTNLISSPKAGIAPAHNLLLWDKSDPNSVPTTAYGTSVDTSTYRTSTASIKNSPTYVQRALRSSPYVGAVGQVATFTMWMKTDASWNGTSGNSKIRFGSTDGNNTPLSVCSYNGVKTSWTQVSCSYTLTATYTSIALTLGNDGTVGNIWYDDMNFTIQ